MGRYDRSRQEYIPCERFMWLRGGYGGNFSWPVIRYGFTQRPLWKMKFRQQLEMDDARYLRFARARRSHHENFAIYERILLKYQWARSRNYTGPKTRKVIPVSQLPFVSRRFVTHQLSLAA